MQRILFFVLAFACVGFCVKEYTIPVIFMHGLSGNEEYGSLIGSLIARKHHGQPFYSLAVDCGDASFKSLFQQVKDVQQAIQHLIDCNRSQFSNGFHLIGHSQGGILTRAVIEASDNFTIRNYISIAGVQAGLYGDCAEFGSSDCDKLTDYLYTPEVQSSISVAQFWRSPDPDRYMKGNTFLTAINNQLNPDPRRKQNILRLKHMYLFGSQDDGVIVPWQSTQMGFFDSDGESIIPMEKQEYYTQDTFGLRTLNEDGRLTLTTVPGVSHVDWIYNENIVEKYILPCLEDK